MRKSGILMPIASLSGEYGIGTLGKASYEFVDLLKKSKVTYWQVLPAGPTGYGDSPYQSFSTFAGNPYFIDLTMLIEEGLLTKEECSAYDWGDNEEAIDYEKIYNARFEILKKAYERSDHRSKKSYAKFVRKNEDWLNDYALYMAIKNAHDNKSFIEWEENIRNRDKEALKTWAKKCEKECDFYRFLQFKFSSQWAKLKSYAEGKGVKIIGDIPIYVAFDSADTWSHPELFRFDENGFPTAVAGCPPDAFCPTGQLWGNPLYNWKYHKKTGYKWWIRRIEKCFEMYDMIRVDHFRGFDEYYAIPYKDPTAEFGKWEKGPGYSLFEAIEKQLGNVNMIAEDLGFITDSVRKLVKKCGYPGMKILQFAFNAGQDSEYLPHNYQKNSVVYTGTHDNDTIVGWYKTLSDEDREMCMEYMGRSAIADDEVAECFIRLAMSSVADLCIIPMQDYLGLEGYARINFPSTLGNNWVWRMKNGAFSKEVAKKIKKMNKLYARA